METICSTEDCDELAGCDGATPADIAEGAAHPEVCCDCFDEAQAEQAGETD